MTVFIYNVRKQDTGASASFSKSLKE